MTCLYGRPDQAVHSHSLSSFLYLLVYQLVSKNKKSEDFGQSAEMFELTLIFTVHTWLKGLFCMILTMMYMYSRLLLS